MKKFHYLLSILLFTQMLSANTLTTPQIIKIQNYLPYSNTAGVHYKDVYDKNTYFRIFNNGKNIGTIETQGNPRGKGVISFFTHSNTNYSIQIQAVKGATKSKLSKAVKFSSRLQFEFTAGKEKSIILNHSINLNGKLTKGDKSQIDFYRWEENGKILKNTAGDDIVYWDESNRENEYKPTKEGVHFLSFIIRDIDGKDYKRSLRIEVIKATAIPPYALILDMQGIVIQDRSTYKMTIKLGDFIPLSGRMIRKKYKQLVDSYHWEKNGKILKNMLNDEILYWDEVNRKNDYKPTKIGREHLKFVVNDIHGGRVVKNLIVDVKDKNLIDDHGNNRSDATKIALNKTIFGEKNYSSDHDFFSFRLKKKQYVSIPVTYGSKSKQVTLYTSNLTKIRSHRSIPGSALYRPINVLLNAGTYYIDAFLYKGKYQFQVKTEDIAPKDEHGNTKAIASKISVNSRINSYINGKTDVDYFYFIPPRDGTITIKKTGLPRMSQLNVHGSFAQINKVHVKKGKRYYFYLDLGFATEGQQQYSLTLTFK